MPSPSITPDLDLDDASEVRAFLASLRGSGVTVIIVDPMIHHLRGHSAFLAEADNVIDLTDGELKFIKRRDEASDAADDEYLIWSNEHRAWWRAASRGYSQGLREAGRYTRDQALRICRDAIYSSLHVGMLAEVPVRACDVADFLKGQCIPASVMTGEG